MNKVLRVTRTVAILFVVAVAFLATCRSYPKIEHQPRGELNGALTLDQNWSPDIRNTQSHISFGSRLLPYDWFLNLEVSDESILFASDLHMKSLGFIPLKASAQNIDALPLGFAEDKTDDGHWVGLTCTACHSGQVHYKGSRIHVDGAPAQINFQKFEERLTAALAALLIDEEKFDRFAKRLSESDVNDLRQKVRSRVEFMSYRIAMNATQTPYGFGRMDAFGQIFNAVSVEALGIPENARSPDAPVSFPVLWDASHLDVVQWNASAPNAEPGPIGQNATTALAVYGTIDLKADAMLGYKSSVQVGNLGEIQSHFYLLTAPKWPEDIFGPIDNALAGQGAEIYAQKCLSCHALVDANDAKRKLRATLVPVESIQTDPAMAKNFVEATAKTGAFEGKKILAGFAGETLGATASTFDIVVHAASSAMANQPISAIRSVLKEWQGQYKVELDEHAKNYKARPLNGLWASAPYLHNGSVPTVHDLLMPAAQRPNLFFVGAVDFNPDTFGLDSTPIGAVSEFNTALYGNSNAGHEIGTDLQHSDKMALIEYLKTL